MLPYQRQQLSWFEVNQTCCREMQGQINTCRQRPGVSGRSLARGFARRKSHQPDPSPAARLPPCASGEAVSRAVKQPRPQPRAAGTRLTNDIQREVVLAADEADGTAGTAVVETIVVRAGALQGQRSLLVTDRIGAAAVREGGTIPKPLPCGAARQGREGDRVQGTGRAPQRARVQRRQPRDGPFPWFSVPAAGPDTDTKP